MNNPVVVVKKRDADTQECGAGLDGRDSMAKITTKFTGWIR
jgi:hypothetical protein